MHPWDPNGILAVLKLDGENLLNSLQQTLKFDTLVY